MIGEKQIIGCSFSRQHKRQHNLMELSGGFMLQDNSVVGSIKIELK